MTHLCNEQRRYCIGLKVIQHFCPSDSFQVVFPQYTSVVDKHVQPIIAHMTADLIYNAWVRRFIFNVWNITSDNIYPFIITFLDKRVIINVAIRLACTENNIAILIPVLGGSWSMVYTKDKMFQRTPWCTLCVIHCLCYVAHCLPWL